MVFFTSTLIVCILYYLQADGLIYVTIIAVVAELINIFMTQTLTKAVEKKAAAKFGKIANAYKNKISALEKSIKEFEIVQEESIKKLVAANKKILAYEEKSTLKDGDTVQTDILPDKITKKTPEKKEAPKEKPEKFVDLPSGSNRKQLPF